MFSRYSLMKEADSAYDIEDGEHYPDPLSVNYAKAKFTSIPVASTLTSVDRDKFWLHMYNNYGLTDHDDLLLNLNGVPYVGMIEPGDVIYHIVQKDLEGFNKD